MNVHHIGYAVRDLDEAVRRFVDLGYTVEGRVDDRPRKVAIALARNGGTVVELIAPLEPGSPVDRLLETGGPAPYHVCYAVASVTESCRELKATGWVVLRNPEPAPALGGALVAFLYHPAAGLIELLEPAR